MIRAKKITKVNGIYIQRNSIKLIQAQEENTDLKEINKSEINILASEQGIIQGLKELKTRNNIEGKLFTIIPRRLITIKYINLPSKDEDEIEKMLKYEVSQLVPYGIEEMVIDYVFLKNVPVDKGYSKVLVAIISKKIIEHHLSFFKHIDLIPEVISLSSICLYNSFRRQYKNKDKGKHLLIHISGGELDAIVVKNGELIFSRGLIFQDEQDVLIKEIRRTLVAYEREAGKEKLDSVILANKRDDWQNISDNFKREFSYSVESLETIDIMSGLLQKKDSFNINLLPKTIQLEKKKAEIKKNISKTGFLLILILLLTFSIVGVRGIKKRNYLLAFNSYIDKVKKEADVIRKQKKRVEIIEEAINSKKTFLEVLTFIYKITPDGLFFKQLIWESNLLIIKGKSTDLNKIIYFIGELKKSPYLLNPQIKYTQKRKLEGREIIDFEVSANISKIQ